MHPAGGLQFDVGKGLRAQADAIYPGFAPCCGLRFVYGFGIGFERYLVGGIAELLADSSDDTGEIDRIEQAWCSAAEIDGVSGLTCGARCVLQSCSGVERCVLSDFPF